MPKHEFLLIPEVEGSSNYGGYFHDPHAIQLEDDLVVYLVDTLNWIPSSNPSNPGEWGGYGLNYWGPTIIDKRGARKAARIFRSWAALLEEGPEQIELTGQFGWIQGGCHEDGRYETFTQARGLVTEGLRRIAELADQAATVPFVLLHLGI